MNSTELNMHTALETLPKSELHLHIEGSLEPELALELADRNGVSLPYDSLADLREQYQFTNLQSFLDLYYELMGTLKTADDFRDLALAYFKKVSAQGVKHAEIFFDPQVHVSNGLDVNMVMDGLLEGMHEAKARYGITSGLILSIVRDMPVDTAQSVLDSVKNRADDILGIGLDSAEVGYPPHLFTKQFEEATALGWHRVAHAGEEGPASYVIDALDNLHAERIDHGIHSVTDATLLERLASERIPLTTCPLSNRRLQVVGSLENLPLHNMMEQGVLINVNSDDPAYFGGYIADNYQALEGVGFTLSELSNMAENSITASFISDVERDALLQQLVSWKSRFASLLTA
ncbi:adenosine deaminase [Bifidobacterium aquikefiricola]|uniref:Adenine deaminase n=1 Tax=Bifidobacterium aquikefiricola TaxID=3059038 RepID=A0AB39U641_9BIFI